MKKNKTNNKTKNKNRKKGKKKPYGKYLKNLRNEIYQIFKSAPDQTYTASQIFKAVGARDKSLMHLITELINVETDRNVLVQVHKGKYQFNKELTTSIEGVVDISVRGKGYIAVDGWEDDLQIAKGETGTAISGDTVRVSIDTSGNKIKGYVEEVIKRGKTRFVGVLQKTKNYAFVVPTSNKIHIDFFIPNKYINNANNGDKVVIELDQWSDPTESPIARVIDVLGRPGDNDVEMNAIMIEYGLPYEFPTNVKQAAEEIKANTTEIIDPAEVKKRRDFREITTITIDPVDAKDFDDALSFQKLKNGNTEIGIHIADVSHYLIPGTILDNEAVERATSVYLVDRTIPMLPEVLSNKLCSLRPDEEKLCFSAVFELDDNAQVKKQWFGRTVIKSNRRFTYEEAQERIETGKGDYAEEINTLDRLAKIMREERLGGGGIDFHSQEVKFKLDPKGKPIGVYIKEMKDSNRLVEDFMLLANRKVAAYIAKQKPEKTFVYRIHDLPDPEKLTTLRNFVFRFGYKMEQPTTNNAGEWLRQLLKKVHGSDEESIIQPLAIRSMSKANYTTENIGHFGLGFDYYTHFTSPIRRYPDVMVHRLLQRYLDKESSANKEKYEELCKHSLVMEKKAQRAEWASIAYKQVEYMDSHVGETFEGRIVGLTSRGMFIELTESMCEGMIRLDTITGDRYIFDEAKYCIRGIRKGNEYHLGEEVDVIITRADLEKRRMDFEIVR